MIYVALVSAYPTEAEARTALARDQEMSWTEVYQGTWVMPLPEQTRVHLFTGDTEQAMLAGGWVQCLPA